MATLPPPSEILYQKEHINESRVPTLLGSGITCLGLAVIAVVLRFISRRLGRIKYEYDDWLIIPGLLCAVGVFACNMAGVRFGLGKHAILLTNAAGLAQITISAEVIFTVGICCVKGSILYLYHRIFFVSRPLTIALWLVAAFVLGYSIAQVFGAIFQCVPIDSNWNPKVTGHCINLDVFATVLAALNSFTDIVILVLPMPLVWRLKRPAHEKVQIMGMFLLGGFVCVASIFRCIYIHDLSLFDPTWTDIPADTWSMVEVDIAVVSACLPTLRPIYLYLFTSKRAALASSEAPTVATVATSEPSLRLQPSHSNPSQSAKFAHLGVLGGGRDLDLEDGGELGVGGMEMGMAYGGGEEVEDGMGMGGRKW